MLGREVTPIVSIEVSSNDNLAPNLRVTGPHTEIDIKTLGKDEKKQGFRPYLYVLYNGCLGFPGGGIV